MNEVYKTLDQLGIKYKKYEHPAVFTCEESEKYCSDLEGAHTKNLFLRNRKGNKHYLINLEDHKKADMKKLSKLLGTSKLSFASPERLMKYLGLTPGSVSPFGLINDKHHEVQVLIDKDILKHTIVNFHPNINTVTIALKSEDFIKFLDSTGNSYQSIKI